MKILWEFGLKLIGCLLLVAALSGCDEKEAELQFDILVNSSPETTKTEIESYNSPYGYDGTIVATGKIKGEEKHTIINISRTNPRLWEGLK